MTKLPHGGRWSRAPEKKYSETVVFIHHFGGTRSSSKRYREYLTQLGFDCVAFNLKGNTAPTWRRPIKEMRRMARNSRKTFQQVWTNNLRDILDAVPGRKILFSFSSPSLAAARILAEEGRADVDAWICDGGPFLDFFDSFRLYYIHRTHFPKWVAPFGALFGLVMVTGLGYEYHLSQWMRKFPESVPVFSIRAGLDQMVPVNSINKFFAMAPQMDLQTLEIGSALHLEGFKHYPEIYKPAIEKFLLAHATQVRST